MELVVLVDRDDNQLGLMEKMEAHEKGLLHRAFSVFLFNSKGEMLLQQRAFSKYHSGGLWTNACCSHPRDGEDTIAAAHRRLEEEMGFDCEIKKAFHFIYKSALDNNLTEHELDHVFIGQYEGAIVPNPEEVESYQYVPVPELVKDVENNPQNYTEWFKICLEEVLNRVEI
ncbi:MAG: isopentenyl-diphosphate Delta-isomerase [Flavobacteriales bacterium]|jgi:isopentenyl-diphosphate delta-isomerase|nr:isopentenyl-diphosphate Delta-isomerase [Flavobacteriales bacterium]